MITRVPLSIRSLKPRVSFGHTGISFANPSGTNKRHCCRICRGIHFLPSYVRKKKKKKHCKSWKTTNEGMVKHCRGDTADAPATARSLGDAEQPGEEMAGCCASLCELPLKHTVFCFLMKRVLSFLYPVFLPTAVIVSLVCSPGVTCIRTCHGAAFLLQEIVSPVCIPR